MLTKEVIDYIRSERALGATRETISAALRQAGWSEQDIVDAFTAATPPMPTPRPAAPAQANISPGINRAAPIMSDITPTARRYGPQNPQVQVTPSIHSTYRKQADNFETYERHKSHKGIGVILFTLAMSFGIWFYITEPDLPATFQTIEQKITGRDNSTTTGTDVKPTDPLLITNIKRAPADKNGALDPLFATTTGISKITKEESDFLKTYSGEFSAKKLPPLAQSTALVKKYGPALAAFNDVLAKPYYQCNTLAGDACPLTILTDVSRLALLNSYIEFRKNSQIAEASAYALSLAQFGSKVAGNGELASLLVGTSLQKSSYALIDYMKAATPTPEKVVTLTEKEKASTIKKTRDNFVLAYRYMYTVAIDGIALTDNPQATTTLSIPQDTRDEITSLASYKTATNWLPAETSFYFLTSYQKAIKNLDLPCSGAGPSENSSVVDTGFNEKSSVDSDNYIGKLVYSTSYAVHDKAFFDRRCELEKAIGGL